MRTDVKVGFAVGGVLLAVLIVYVLVISSGPPQRNNDAALAKPELVPAGDGQASNTTAAPGTQTDGTAQTGSQPSDGSSGAVAANTAAGNDPFQPSVPGGTDGGAEKSTPAADKWEAALSTGRIETTDKPPLLLVTETPSDTTSASPALVDSSAGASRATAAESTEASIAPVAPTDAGATDASGPSLAEQILGAAPATQPSSLAGASGSESSASPGTSGMRTHVVQRGESFATIAAAVYGNSAYYPHLLRANPNVNPKKLRPGMVVNIPHPDDVIATSTSAKRETSPSSAAGQTSGATLASAALPPIDERTQYRVQSNDSLYKISLKLYGKANRTEKLYELNKELIGANPSHLKVGMVLKLPEPPTATATATTAGR